MVSASGREIIQKSYKKLFKNLLYKYSYSPFFSALFLYFFVLFFLLLNLTSTFLLPKVSFHFSFCQILHQLFFYRSRKYEQVQWTCEPRPEKFLIFRKSRRSCKRKALFWALPRNAAPGDGNHRRGTVWRGNSQACPTFFTFSVRTSLLHYLQAWEGPLAQTPRVLYTAPLVISCHPPTKRQQTKDFCFCRTMMRGWAVWRRPFFFFLVSAFGRGSCGSRVQSQTCLNSAEMKQRRRSQIFKKTYWKS